MAADVTITEFTDPACPWAFSSEPFRWKLDWLYGDRIVRALLRSLRVRTFSGELLDAQETIHGAARDAGIDPAALAQWMAGEDVRAALDEDMAAAREPTAAALALDARLADWSGGRRYTCPSYELARDSDGLQLSAPGFQPFRVYDVITANLMPGVERRATPESVAEVLAWAGTPLASEEIAVICEISLADAREQLSRVAVEEPVGSDGYWTLAG